MNGSETISITTFLKDRNCLVIGGLLLCGLTGCQTAVPPKEETPENKSPTPEILEVLPENTEKPISRDTELIIRFSLPIDPGTVIVNQEDNQCSGNVQLSADGFQTCIRIKSPSVASDRQEFKFTPQGIYKPGRRYRLRLTSGIKTLEGGTLKEKEHPETFTMYSTQLLGAPGNDRGLAIHVLSDVAGQEIELLAFDCFERAPHYHYGPRNKDIRIYWDTTLVPDTLEWTLKQFASGNLPNLIERAGYPGIVAELDKDLIISKVKDESAPRALEIRAANAK